MPSSLVLHVLLEINKLTITGYGIVCIYVQAHQQLTSYMLIKFLPNILDS